MGDVDHDPHRIARDAARSRPGTRRFAVAMPRAASAAVLVVGLLGCLEPLPLPEVALPRAIAQARHAHVARRIGLEQATRQFRTHALYALLEPLLDAGWPARWDDPSLSFECEVGEVTVDGEPLDVGAPVPERRFTVRWHMQRCAPFGDSTELTGDVVLTVEPSAGTYRAIVQPGRLHLASPYGHKVLADPFTAAWHAGE